MTETRLVVVDSGRKRPYKKRDIAHAKKDAIWYEGKERYETWIETREIGKWAKVEQE